MFFSSIIVHLVTNSLFHLQINLKERVLILHQIQLFSIHQLPLHVHHLVILNQNTI